MNKILRTLVLSDLFILSSFGLIQPVFAVFLIKSISGASITAIGIAATVQLFTKAAFQILVARWTDAERGNCRELHTLIAGSLLISIVPLGYALSSTIAHIYITQFFYGLGQALSYPSWRVIFTRYTSRDHAGFEWGVYDTVISFGVAGAAALGAFLAEAFSFPILFIIISILSFAGTGFLAHVFQQEFSCPLPLRTTVRHGHKTTAK